MNVLVTMSVLILVRWILAPFKPSQSSELGSPGEVEISSEVRQRREGSVVASMHNLTVSRARCVKSGFPGESSWVDAKRKNSWNDMEGLQKWTVTSRWERRGLLAITCTSSSIISEGNKILPYLLHKASFSRPENFLKGRWNGLGVWPSNLIQTSLSRGRALKLATTIL